MKTPKVVVLDYGIGNVRSIKNAFEAIGVETNLTNEKQKILESDALVLPGVGAFRQGMENLKNKNLIQTIEKFVSLNRPFLGICLGMQMLFEKSNEFGDAKGLGLIKGVVSKLDSSSQIRLPHVSWNELERPEDKSWKGTILETTDENSNMYFVHTYAGKPLYKEDILANTNYENILFCSAVQNKNVYGTQFHPEKSGENGLKILQKFVNII